MEGEHKYNKIKAKTDIFEGSEELRPEVEVSFQAD
jgi:hypothetical protein